MASESRPDSSRETRPRRGMGLRVERREVDGQQKPVIVGLASVFNSNSVTFWEGTQWAWRERIRPGAFASALARADLDVIACFNHDPDKILGRSTSGTLRLRETPDGLEYECDPPASAADIVELLERGDLDSSSFMFTVAEERWTLTKDGTPDEREIIRVDELFDVSVVTWPAYPAATAGVRSLEGARSAESRGRESAKDRERREREIGLRLRLGGHRIAE